MNDAQRNEVLKAAQDGLNRAVDNWNKVGHLMKKAMVMDSVVMEACAGTESNIPGHPFIEDGKPEVDEFVALVVDMRKSSARLKSVEYFPGIESGFQRVYYETSALLPALAQTALQKDGHVTEYLGDGVLILFRVDPAAPGDTVKEAYRAAANCVTTSRQLVNELLYERFQLPPLHIGAGLARSQALVTLVGIPGNMQPKAMGQCVWEASKLSDGVNRVHVAEMLRKAWPSSKGGVLKFKRLPESRKHNVEGFLVRAG